MFDKTNWAYNDLNTIFQFCKWAEEQTDWHEIFTKASKTAGESEFIKRALIGYMKAREKREDSN